MAVNYTRGGVNSETGKWETEKFVGAFPGAVLKRYTQTVQVMSDIWEPQCFALVWNTEACVPETKYIENLSDAVVDATPEVLAAYRAYVLRCYLEDIRRKDFDDAATPAVGKVVRVFRGRSDKGTVGPIVHSIQRPYSMGYRSAERTKFAIAKDDVTYDVTTPRGKVFKRYANVAWAWEMNVQVVDPMQYTRSEQELLDAANRYVDSDIMSSLANEWQPMHRFFNVRG